MNPRIAFGTTALAVGLVAAIFSCAFLFLGMRTGSARLIARGRLLAVSTFVSALVATGVMEWALLTHDFGIKYVAAHNAKGTPLLYTVTGLWAALEGSILLWALILTGYVTFMVYRTRKSISHPDSNLALIVALCVTAFFLLMLLVAANPFAATDGPIPLDGRGPNPLLANHALMAFHPPILYLGYVGFVVPFAFTIAGLVSGRLDEKWVVATRRSTLFAWTCLTIGILLGAWWSYAVLGWGGYWAWDPVENASVLPWITGTALLHSIMVQEQRPAMRVWNVALVQSTFALTILGTFLTRSGVVASVHAFSQSPTGPWLLVLLGLVVFGGLGLVAVRGPELRQQARTRGVFSREGAFAANNLAFTVLAAVVLLGTVFPLIAKQFGQDELTVGPPYFDKFAAPLGMVLLFLMAIAPMLPWGRASAARVESSILGPTLATAVVMGLSVAGGVRSGWALGGFGLATFAGVATLTQLVGVARSTRDLRRIGGLLVHLGVVVIAVAITASQQFASKHQVTLSKGEVGNAGGYRLEYEGRTVERTSDRIRISARIHVREGDESLGVFRPSVSVFPNANQAIGNPAIDTGLTEDVYLTLVSSPTSSDEVQVTLATNPMVGWIWGGGGIIGIGAALAMAARPRRGKERESFQEQDQTDSSDEVRTECQEHMAQ